MWPAIAAGLMVCMLGFFGTGVRTAHAIDGDICAYYTDAPEGIDNNVENNDVHIVEKGATYGLVFRADEDDLFDMPNVTIRIDSETGSAKITSKAEILDIENGFQIIEVGHVLVTPPASTQVVDTIDPDSSTAEPQYFTDPDGNPVDGINGWLEDVAGMSGFADDSINVCGVVADEDLWGFIDFECIEFGTFFIDILTPDDTEETGLSVKFVCPGVPNTAKISAFPTSVETYPATYGIVSNASKSTITATVYDQDGDNLDDAHVTLTTDNCTFVAEGSSYISPAGGGKTVDIMSDTDGAGPDQNFLADNPLQTQAGTAEAVLDCTGTKGTPGTAHITAVVNRPGQDIVLSQEVKVVGPTAVNGLTLTLSSASVVCGNPITATAKAVDGQGVAVSEGTPIWFTTDTSSGVVGGNEGAQGGVPTVGGSASVIIATDPGNPGTHTVIAYVINAAGGVAVQTSATYSCTVPAAPTVTAPATGTGTGSITPPNTGDAGLASSSSSVSLLSLVCLAALALAGIASLKFARR
jgi:hypothetical protein